LLGSIPIQKKEGIADKKGNTRKLAKNGKINTSIKNSKIDTENSGVKNDFVNMDINNQNVINGNLQKNGKNGINEIVNGDDINDGSKSSINNAENSNNINKNIINNEQCSNNVNMKTNDVVTDESANNAYKHRIFSYCCELWCLYVTILSR
jgi:putative cell wall-binding protein